MDVEEKRQTDQRPTDGNAGPQSQANDACIFLILLI